MPRWSRRPLSHGPAARLVFAPSRAALLQDVQHVHLVHHEVLLVGSRHLAPGLPAEEVRVAHLNLHRNWLSGRPAERMLQSFRLSPSGLPYLGEP